MSQEDKPCSQHPDAPHGFDRNASHNAGRYVCECEGWQSEVSALQEKIAFALGKPVAAQEPFAWATFDGEGSYELRLFADNETYDLDFISLNGEKYAGWVIPLYANAAPCARCAKLDRLHKHAIAELHKAFNREESAKAELRRREERSNPSGFSRRVEAQEAWDLLRSQVSEAQAKITEQAAEIERLHEMNRKLNRRTQKAESFANAKIETAKEVNGYFLGSANQYFVQQLSDRIKALEAEAADRESFLKTLADTCTEAERIAIERAGRIDVLKSECRKLRDALSETEAFCKRKDITIERQRKVIEAVKQFVNTPISVESCTRMNASIVELEKGVG